MNTVKNSNSFQEIILDAIEEPIYGLDVNFNIRVWNDAMSELVGLPAKDVVGKSVFEVFSIEKDTIESNLSSRTSTTQFVKFNDLEFSTVISRIDKGGQRLGYRGGLYSLDKGILKALPREQLVEVINSSPISTVVFNTNGSIIYSNNAYIDMWKLGDEELKFLNNKYNIFLDKQLEKQGLMPFIKSAFAGEQHKSPVFKYTFNTAAVGRPDEERTNWLLANIYPIYNDSGEIANVVLNFTDVGEQYKLEIAVKESQQRLELALDGGNLGTWDWDAESEVLVYNDRWAEMLGFTLEEVYEISWENMIHPEDKAVTDKALKDLMDGRTDIYDCEFRLRTKNGGWKWILSRGKRVKSADGGKSLRVAGTHTDITERKEIEDRIKENEIKYRRLVENAPIGIAIIADEKLMFINKELARIGGVDNKEEVIGVPARNFIPDDDQYKVFMERYHRVVEGQNAPLYTTQLKSLPGKIIDIEVVSIPIKFDGKSAMQVLINDISDRKLVLDELAKNKELLNQLFENSPMGIVLLDVDFNVNNINKGFEKIFGIKPEEIKGKSLSDFIIPAELMEEAQSLNDSALKGEMNYFESYRYNKLGEKVPVIIYALPVMENGRHIGIYGVYIDIRQRVKAEQELQTRNSELDNFVYKVSHDLRSPLASILGLINLTKLEGEKADKEHYIDLMEGQVLKLDHFIHDILSHSKNLKMSVAADRIDFKEMVNKCFEDLSYLGGASKIIRKITIDDGMFFSDKWRISEIFRNLISNAIKYRNQEASENIVEVSVAINVGGCNIRVADNGIGIPVDKLPHVLEMFYRGTEYSDGSGIGLYIVQKAVDKINGKLNIESTPAQGTVIEIWLPSLSKLVEHK